jgi:hemolysin D
MNTMPPKQSTAGAQALDFAPDLLAIQESPPEKLPRAVLLTVAVLFGILLLWAVFGRLDIIASSEGRLVPQTYLKIVQPADAGIVLDILVKEGQAVQAGQVLMRLDPKLAQADLHTLQDDAATKALTLRRIDAELKSGVFLQQKGDPPELYTQILAQFTARQRAYRDAVAQETETLNKARNELLAAQQIRRKLTETLPIVQQQAAAQARLAKEGFLSELAAKDKERERIEREQDVKAQEATVAALQNLIAQSEMKIAQIRSNYESQLRNERVEVASASTRAEGELTKQRYRAGLLELKAPQAGIVKDLATHTHGTVVSPGTILMTLVPQNEPLTAEVQIKNEDVGFVSVGQTVRVKLAAYPFQKYGMVEGEVEHVGADANSQPQQDGDRKADAPPGMTYKALVKLKEQVLTSARGESLRLAPGMQVTAEIHQGNRSVMEYLLSPVQRVVGEAGRER